MPSPHNGHKMAQRTRLGRLRFGRAVLALITLLAVTVTAMADVPAPAIPKGQGDQCVEDTQFMRKNHMELLMHQRDATMHQGIRTKAHSLKECFSCHSVKDQNGRAVGYEDPKHFCRVCHDYAAVKVDCFGCHSSLPASAQSGGSQ